MFDCITSSCSTLFVGLSVAKSIGCCITGVGGGGGGGGIPPYRVGYGGIFHHKGYGLLSCFDLK